MRPRRLIALAVVVMALGAYILFVERHAPTTDELKKREDKVFPAMDTSKIRRVVIVHAKDRFELAKENDTWKLVAPIADEANESAVTDLLSSLSGLEAEGKLDAKDVKLADYGLDAPGTSVAVTDDQGIESKLELGAELPLGSTRAARTGPDRVLVVSRSIAASLEKGLSAWRSDELARLSSADAESLTIRDAAGRVALTRSQRGWALTEPISDLAESGAGRRPPGRSVGSEDPGVRRCARLPRSARTRPAAARDHGLAQGGQAAGRARLRHRAREGRIQAARLQARRSGLLDRSDGDRQGGRGRRRLAIEEAGAPRQLVGRVPRADLGRGPDRPRAEGRRLEGRRGRGRRTDPCRIGSTSSRS